MIQIENQGTQIIQTYKKYTANFHAKKKAITKTISDSYCLNEQWLYMWNFENHDW